METNVKQCPRCSSFETEKLRPVYIASVGAILAGMGAWLFFIPILGLFFLITGLAALVISPFTQKLYTCKECKKIWKPAPPSGKNIIRFLEKNYPESWGKGSTKNKKDSSPTLH